MAEQQNVINTRIQLKYDTWNKWQSASFVPLAGEICIVRFGDSEDDGLANEAGNILFKVGNGNTSFSALPWASALAADVYDWAKAESVRIENKALEFYTTGNDKPILKIELNYLTPEEANEIIGSLDNLNTTDKSSLVGAINEVHTIASKVKEVEYVNDEIATIPEDDTVNVINNLTVNSDNDKYTFTEETTQVATAKAFTYSNPEPPINTVGGINPGTDMSEITFKEFVEKMLYPYTLPIISVSRTPNTTTALEKGDNQTISSVAVTVTKKSEPITRVALYNGSTLIGEPESDVASGGTFNFTVNIFVDSTNVVLTAKATDKAGNTVSANTADWNFVYPYYYGECTIDEYLNIAGADLRDTTKFKTDVAVKGNNSYSYTTDNKCMLIAYPKEYKELKSVIGPGGYEYVDEFALNFKEISVTGRDGTTQPYYVYRNNPTTNTGFVLTFIHQS